MKIDGAWHITVKTFDGDVENRLVAVSDGAGFIGTLTGPTGQTQPVAAGNIDGAKVSWSASFIEPAPMTVTFTGVVDGDQMTGTLQAGNFPESTFTAQREARP